MNMHWVLCQDIITNMIIYKIVKEKLKYLVKNYRQMNRNIDLFGGFDNQAMI